MKNNIRGITFAAVIAAVYTVICITPGISALAYGPVQFRFAEILTIAPIISPYGIAGLTVGCLISNLFSPVGLPDIVFGTLATLAAALLTYYLRKKPNWIALLPPVLVNALIIGIMITVFYTPVSENFLYVLLFNIFTVAVGEAGICYVLGLPLLKLLNKHKKIVKEK